MAPRSLLAVALLLVAAVCGPAAADAKPQDVDSMLKVHFDQLSKRASNAKLDVSSKDFGVIRGDDMDNMPLAGELFPGDKTRPVKIKREGKAAVVTDGDVAWFQQTFVATHIEDIHEYTHDYRLSGLAIANAGKWEIVGVHYAEQIPDDKFWQGQGASFMSSANALKEPALQGDKDLSKAVASWFGKMSTFAASGVDVLAGGTAFDENGRGEKAVKIVKSWDRLKMKANIVKSKTFGDGNVGFVYAVVIIDNPKAGHTVRAVLTIAVRKEKDGWRWLSMQFSS